MLTMNKLTLMGSAVALSAFLLSPKTQAATYSDAGAAVLVYPKIVVTGTADTVVQIANQSLSRQTAAHCFYVNANSRCTNNGDVCTGSSDCFDPASMSTGACLPGWIEINFDVILTPGQPLAWSAANGLSNKAPIGLENFHLPCPGGLLNPSSCKGNNAGTRVPPVGEVPFIGELKCIESDPTTRLPAACGNSDNPAAGLDCVTTNSECVASGDPSPCCTGAGAGVCDPGSCCHDDLIGSASIEDLTVLGDVDVERYNAVGLRSTGFNDGDNELVIGGLSSPEYEPCADVLVFNHLFDGATDPITGVALASSELTLVPCTEDFERQAVPQVTAQFLVYNEFEQRVSTSKSVNCLLDSPISLIDTTQPTRSIFSAGVQGTVAGQTRITGVNGGLIGSATLALGAGSTGYNLNQFADRDTADFIRIP